MLDKRSVSRVVIWTDGGSSTLSHSLSRVFLVFSLSFVGLLR